MGGVLGALGASRRQSATALAVTAALLVAGTLFFALPEPEFRGNVLEASVESCGSPLFLKEEAFDHWDKRLAATSWAAVRPGWKEGFASMAADDPGVDLGVTVRRSTGVYDAAGDPRVSKTWPPVRRRRCEPNLDNPQAGIHNPPPWRSP